MKVFLVNSAEIYGKSADSMEAHILSGFGDLGMESRYFPFRSYGYGARINRILDLLMTDYRWIDSTPAERAMLKEIGVFRPDLIIVLLGNYTSPSTIRKIRTVCDAPVVCWCQDHMGTMGRQYMIGAGFDFIFAKDAMLVDLLRRYSQSKEVHYLPEACNPQVHRSVALTAQDIEKYACDITTAGTLYYYRGEILSAVSDFDVRIWGSVPRHYDGSMRDIARGVEVVSREKAACFNAARIVINTLHPMEIGGLNARAFETAGCGGFQLITHSEVVERYFEPGKEIETFRDLDELRDKVRYYLPRGEERKKIAAAGQRRAHAEHTYRHRLQQMLNIMKLA